MFELIQTVDQGGRNHKSESCERSASSSSSPRMCPMEEIEDISKVMVHLEKMYEEELKKREKFQEELGKIKEDRDRIIREAQDQKKYLEEKVSILEHQNLLINSELARLPEQDKDNVGVFSYEETKIFEELLHQPPDTQSSIEFPNFSNLSYLEIVEATNGFHPSMLYKEDERGSIFKGTLYNTPITMRWLFSSRLFKQEVKILSMFQHPNLGNMLGACQDVMLAIVYEHLPNGSLDERLACTNGTPPLLWQERIRIASELLTVLIFLQYSSTLGSVVHCALRPSCLYLDSHFTCKLIGFDFSNIISHDKGSFNTTTRNKTYALSIYTNDYNDPVFKATKEVSTKCDVYSFGVILLQLLTGMPTIGLIEEVRKALGENRLGSLLDVSAGDWSYSHAYQLTQLALRCCNREPNKRPDIKSEVWTVIEPMITSSGLALTSKVNEVPSYFICPISCEIMRDPHFAADGHTYEAEAIQKWLDGGRSTSPMTNLPLQHNQLTPNLLLRSVIQEWLQHQSN